MTCNSLRMRKVVWNRKVMSFWGFFPLQMCNMLRWSWNWIPSQSSAAGCKATWIWGTVQPGTENVTTNFFKIQNNFTCSPDHCCFLIVKRVGDCTRIFQVVFTLFHIHIFSYCNFCFFNCFAVFIKKLLGVEHLSL